LPRSLSAVASAKGTAAVHIDIPQATIAAILRRVEGRALARAYRGRGRWRYGANWDYK